MQEDGYDDGKIQAVPRAVQLKKHVKFMQRTIDVLPSAYGFFDSSRYQFVVYSLVCCYVSIPFFLLMIKLAIDTQLSGIAKELDDIFEIRRE